jgi:Rrf2 family transcriptional regulator, repressor of oqxAB
MNSQISAPLGWFRVAVQGLVMLAETGKICPSTAIARDLKAHAVFVRRVMAQLVQAQIVVAREGRDGGYRLARPADAITLAEVYQAVKEACHVEDTAVNQYKNRRVQQVFGKVEADLEQHLLELLSQYTIASLIESTAPSF